MQYNIHPLFVHFPIAFLLLYSLLRIIPIDRWFPKFSWQQIRLVVLLAGVLGAMVASSTGETAVHIAQPDRSIVNMHSFFAATATWIYGLLLIGELLVFINPYIAKFFPENILLAFLRKIQQILTYRVITLLLAILGALAISITGLLGGVMVYGTSADPLAPFVLRILGLTL